MELRINKYLCDSRCERVKHTVRKSEEEHAYMKKKQRSMFVINQEREYQEIYFLKTINEKYLDLIWEGKV